MNISPKLMRTAETSLQTLRLKPFTMVQVFVAVVLVAGCVTKTCSSCNCPSNDLHNKQCRLTQWLYRSPPPHFVAKDRPQSQEEEQPSLSHLLP